METLYRSPLSVGFLMVAVGLLAGCSDLVEAPVEDEDVATAEAVRSVDGTAVPRGAMERQMAALARHIAVAVSDQDLRHRVHDALQTSPFREGKLHFRTLLEDSDVGLLRGMSAAGEMSRTGIMASLDSIVDLEFYMPVEEHRATWDGGTDLLVVSLLDDEKSLPSGFDLAGEEIAVSLDTPPSTPSLVITPAETDFSSPTTRYMDVQASVQTMPYADSAWIMYEAWVMDQHEPWVRGTPELEVHTWQEQPSGIIEDIICSGEHMPAPYYWDMDDATWSDSVHLATQAILDTTVVTEFQMWEDDDGECNNNGGGKPPKASSSAEATIEAAVNLINEIYQGVTGGFDIDALQKTASYAYDFISAGSDDDYVGLMLGPENGCWPPREDGEARFIIRYDEGGSTQGDAMIDVTYGERSPLCALDVDIVGPDTVYNCDPQDPTPYPAEYQADVFGGDGSTITYEWREDGVISGSGASYQMQDYSAGTRRVEVHVDRGAEEDSDLLFVQVVQEDPEESEHCVA